MLSKKSEKGEISGCAFLREEAKIIGNVIWLWMAPQFLEICDL